MSTHFSLRLLTLQAVVSLTFIITNLAAAASPLRAGVGRVKLTPPLETKAALGGYGARMSKPATGEHHAIWAKALVSAQDEHKFARCQLALSF